MCILQLMNASNGFICFYFVNSVFVIIKLEAISSMEITTVFIFRSGAKIWLFLLNCALTLKKKKTLLHVVCFFFYGSITLLLFGVKWNMRNINKKVFVKLKIFNLILHLMIYFYISINIYSIFNNEKFTFYCFSFLLM